MHENNDEVSPLEIKAFMNEPDLEPKDASATHPPQPMGVDDWSESPEQAMAHDHKLTTLEIAEIAYNAANALSNKIGGTFADAWQDLKPDLMLYYSGIVTFFINSAANPNGHESCQALHDLMLDAQLRDGWTYGENYSEDEKKNPLLLSYKGLPTYLKTQMFLIRCVTVGLIAVWKGH